MSTSIVALPSYAFDHVRATVRQADVRYSYMAHLLSHQLAHSLTHHARSLALKRGLTIDTVKAKRCPQRAVSERPLPVIDLVLPSPPIVTVRPTPVYASNYGGGNSIQLPALLPSTMSDSSEEDEEEEYEQMIFSPLESDDEQGQMDVCVSPMNEQLQPKIMWRIRREPCSFEAYMAQFMNDHSNGL